MVDGLARKEAMEFSTELSEKHLLISHTKLNYYNVYRTTRNFHLF